MTEIFSPGPRKDSLFLGNIIGMPLKMSLMLNVIEYSWKSKPLLAIFIETIDFSPFLRSKKLKGCKWLINLRIFRVQKLFACLELFFEEFSITIHLNIEFRYISDDFRQAPRMYWLFTDIIPEFPTTVCFEDHFFPHNIQIKTRARIIGQPNEWNGKILKWKCNGYKLLWIKWLIQFIQCR